MLSGYRTIYAWLNAKQNITKSLSVSRPKSRRAVPENIVEHLLKYFRKNSCSNPAEYHDIYTLTTMEDHTVENVTRTDKLELVLDELFDSIALRSVTSKDRWREQSRQQGLLLYKTDLNKTFDNQIGEIISVIYYSNMTPVSNPAASYEFSSDFILLLYLCKWNCIIATSFIKALLALSVLNEHN